MKAIKAKKPTTARRSVSKATRKPAPEIPPILLEGDTTPSLIPSGPGERYALGPTAAEQTAAEEGAAPAKVETELPEAYGTKRLLLTAREPRWLWASWDLTREQLKRYNGLSAHGHLILRIYKDVVADPPCVEQHVHPDSRSWYVNVPEGGAKYLARIGYQPRRGAEWVSISTSAATVTPPDAMSSDLSVWFETLPSDVQFEKLVGVVRKAVAQSVPLMEAIQQLRAAGYPGLPGPREVATGRWTPEQERALTELVQMDASRRVWMGSLEITELIRRQFQQELYSAAAAQFSLPEAWSGALGSISSPFGAMLERRRRFFFQVNAELIIYGATEPDAEVKIGGRVIRLRPDGSFSYRFALPDGQYELDAVATSADGVEQRQADLKFSRGSEYRGEVGRHPQDPLLKPPLAAHVA